MHSIQRPVLVAVTLLGLAAPAAGHIQLGYPDQRTTSQKDGPCGAPGSMRGSTVTYLTPGSTITVAWNETVDHPGHYRVSFDADGQDFSNPITGAEDFPATLVDDIADRNTGTGDDSYSVDVTLPDIECANCTLQLIQVMKAAPPFAESDLYYQCADVVLTNTPPVDAGPDGTPDAAGGGGTDGGPGGGGGDDGGCGCAANGRGGASGPLVVLAALALAFGRRRRR